MLRDSIRKILVGSALSLMAANAQAGTTLDFWHSYRHGQTGEMHYCFHLSRCKRGLFWGSCGPSTKSQQWAFTFDLAGDGPTYSSQQLSISDDNARPMRVASGQVITNIKRMTAKIDVEIESGGHTNKFAGNGEYAIHTLK